VRCGSFCGGMGPPVNHASLHHLTGRNHLARCS
jgi:hypothetical protein